MRQRLWFVPFLWFSLAACQASPPKWAADVNEPEPQRSPPDDIQITDGQTVYVPVYSHVFWTETKHFPLAISLSIRNTDPEHAISLVDVSYYDSIRRARPKLPERTTITLADGVRRLLHWRPRYARRRGRELHRSLGGERGGLRAGGRGGDARDRRDAGHFFPEPGSRLSETQVGASRARRKTYP